MRDPKQHAARRRLLARPFSTSSLRANWETLVKEKARKTVSILKTESKQGLCDVMKWWSLMATDVVGELAFGHSLGLVDDGAVSYPYLMLTAEHYKL